MTAEVGAMTATGVAALVAGLVWVGPRFRAASGAGRLLVLGPLCDAIALAVFAAEHFTDAHGMAPMVPGWLPAHLFWIYFFGAALLAAAISFIIWRSVRWAAAGLALFFLLVVATMDVPGIPSSFHERFFWILTFRETCFASGAIVLWGSVWPRGGRAGAALVKVGRSIVAAVMIFYAVEHFLFPHQVPGVPLEKVIPAWMPAPVLMDWVVGLALLLGGIGLFFRPRIAAAGAGGVILLVTVFFYLPMCVLEFHTAPVEGLNYLFDTLLFAGTVLLAGLGTETEESVGPSLPRKTHAGV